MVFRPLNYLDRHQCVRVFSRPIRDLKIIDVRFGGRFPVDVANIVEMKKQFNEIDFDQSGQVASLNQKPETRNLKPEI
jgi:hypothetical protein